MINFIQNIVKNTFLGNVVIKRIFNHYTTKGLILVGIQLESMGMLPGGFSSVLSELPIKEIATWLILGLGLYFIIHRPKDKAKDKSKNNLAAMKDKLEILKINLEVVELIEKLKKLKQ